MSPTIAFLFGFRDTHHQKGEHQDTIQVISFPQHRFSNTPNQKQQQPKRQGEEAIMTLLGAGFSMGSSAAEPSTMNMSLGK